MFKLKKLRSLSLRNFFMKQCNLFPEIVVLLSVNIHMGY